MIIHRLLGAIWTTGMKRNWNEAWGMRRSDRQRLAEGGFGCSVCLGLIDSGFAV